MSEEPKETPNVHQQTLDAILRIEEMLAARFNPNHTLRHHLENRAKDGKAEL